MKYAITNGNTKTNCIRLWTTIHFARIPNVLYRQRHTSYQDIYVPSQTNGLVERLVQTFKRRVDMSEGNLELTLAQFLMTYRNTKKSSTGVSPAVLMFRRRLSTIWDRLRPNIQTTVQSRR
ncbi:hypothetical protein GJ496_009382 [Pomphorhynchus laevis]|nr:hypothetical protein GJ496_009382 [Pomphorhynchus laevis]